MILYINYLIWMGWFIFIRIFRLEKMHKFYMDFDAESRECLPIGPCKWCRAKLALGILSGTSADELVQTVG